MNQNHTLLGDAPAAFAKLFVTMSKSAFGLACSIVEAIRQSGKELFALHGGSKRPEDWLPDEIMMEIATINALIREYLKSGMSLVDFVGPPGQERILELPRRGHPGQMRRIKVTRDFLRRKLKAYRTVYGVKRTKDLPVDQLFSFHPDLADGRFALTGPQFQIQDGPIIYLLAAKHHHPQWSWMECHRSLQRYLERTDCPFKGKWNLPSPESMYRLMRMLPRQIMTLLLEGSEAHWRKFGFSPRRGVDTPHGIVVGDTLTLGRITFVDPATNKRFHPMITFLLEARSRVIMGYVVHATKLDALEFLSLVRRAILPKGGSGVRPYGLFSVLWTDNAPEFKAGFVKILLESLHIEKEECRVKTPSDNGEAERFVQTIKAQLTAFVEDCAMADPTLDLKAGVRGDQWPHFVRQVENYIYVQYHGRVHDALGTTPISHYTSATIDESHFQFDVKTIKEHTCYKVRRKVTKRGIRYNGDDYICEGIQEWVGEEAVLIIDPDKPATHSRIRFSDGTTKRAVLNAPGASSSIARSAKKQRNATLASMHQAAKAVSGIMGKGKPATSTKPSKGNKKFSGKKASATGNSSKLSKESGKEPTSFSYDQMDFSDLPNLDFKKPE